jgi:hypothetical protein
MEQFNKDAQLLKRTITRLQQETGLNPITLHDMMETMAALLLNHMRDKEFSDDPCITVTAGSLRAELLDLGLPPHEVTSPNVEKVLESLLDMAR